jgi:transcriptional regulator with XRE-family HTH domain
MSVGTNIKTRRKELGLTLQELANKAKSSKSYIWELEQDKIRIRPSAAKVIEIAKALEVTPNWLFDGGNVNNAEDEAFYEFYLKLPENTKEQIRQISKILGTYRSLKTNTKIEDSPLSPPQKG